MKTYIYGKKIIKEKKYKLSNKDIPIESPGCFTLLPTMLSEDLFTVRKEIPQLFTGSVNHINNQILNCSIKLVYFAYLAITFRSGNIKPVFISNDRSHRLSKSVLIMRCRSQAKL